MKNLILTTLLIGLCSFVTFASSKVYSGYIILNNHAKIEGSITMLSPSLNEIKVKFTSKDGKTTLYKSKDVQEYGFTVERWNDATRKNEVSQITYIRKNVDRPAVAFGSTEILLERELTGAINLYNHFIEQNSKASQPFAHLIYVEKEVDILIPLDKNNYKIILKKMTNDYPTLSEKIGTRGYGYKHATEIINTYNDWKQQNENIALDMK